MKSLHELSLLQRIGLAIGIVVFALIVLIFISWLVNEPAQGAPPDDLYADIPFDPALLRLDKQALAEAYGQQVKHLFSIWVKGQARGTVEISNGLRIARQAYGAASAQIAKREQRQDYQQQNKGTPK